MKKVFLFGLLLFLISGLALSFPACKTTSTTSETTTSSVPTIVAFSASPAEITAGQPATLLWNVTNATSVQIDQGVGTGLALAGTTSVSPSASATYTLTASNAAGSATQSVTVTVTSSTSTPPSPPSHPPPALPPNIVFFDITPNIIHVPPGPGPNKAVMRWEVQNATSVTINGITESSSGNRILTPSLGTHTFMLKATNAQGAVTRSQVLRVTP